MQDNKSFTNIRSLLGALAKSMNLINPDMEHHHEQTAYLAYLIGTERGMDVEDLHLMIYAALLHDVGAVVWEKQQSVLEIEKKAKYVSAMGARMLRDLDRFEEIANVIEICQNSYTENLKIAARRGGRYSTYIEIADAIHLADTVSIILKEDVPVLNQVKPICAVMEECRGKEYSSETVDAFLKVSRREFVWLDIMLNPSFLMIFTGDIHPVSLEETVQLTGFMSRIIDFRSPFTAMHSAGVAASAKKLAGMSEEECLMMEIAGNLHDIGKLRVPRAILEKPGKLDEEEFNVVKEHTYYTRLILMDVEGFGKIADWAGFHHEKLNGRGYPFHFDAPMLDQGARIMAVADIFSAITEERPYRKGMDKENALKVLHENVESGGISGELVELLEAHYEEVDAARDARSREAGKRYFASLEQEA
ncbi:MAG: HD domain-containing protein [Lachnospiraceae bacterium]|nr:HD domain-containing protein [Lachnospiraceae bacterium]